MFPPEVITFIVTFVLRAIVDKWMQAGEDRRMERAMDKDFAVMEAESQACVRAQIPKLLFGWTTALLAVMAFTCIIGVRIVGPLFFGRSRLFRFFRNQQRILIFSRARATHTIPGATRNHLPSF